MLLLNTCVGDIEASPQPSPWERAYRYSCLLISYKTNLAPSPTERAGGEASLSTLQMLKSEVYIVKNSTVSLKSNTMKNTLQMYGF